MKLVAIICNGEAMALLSCVFCLMVAVEIPLIAPNLSPSLMREKGGG